MKREFEFNEDVAPKLQTETTEMLDTMKVDELLTLRDQIDSKLPARALKDLDLEQELVVQFQIVKALQTTVMAGGGVPANQRAQVANTCASTLAQLTKMQSEYYTAERFKAIEQTLVRAMTDSGLPDEVVKKFLDEYEALG